MATSSKLISNQILKKNPFIHPTVIMRKKFFLKNNKVTIINENLIDRIFKTKQKFSLLKKILNFVKLSVNTYFIS